MSGTDDLLVNARRYAETFDKGELPLPPALGVAVVACMDARLHVTACSAWRNGRRRASMTWMPTCASPSPESRPAPFIPRTDQVRGFVYDVLTGELREVAR